MHLQLKSLLPHYTHLLFATGSPKPIRDPFNSASDYVRSALSLVHWYTSHPASLGPPPLEHISHVSIIGHGNVALDVARILLSPVSRLEKYDLPEDVLNVLRKSSVKHVTVLGRRGPGQMKFGAKEVREMVNLEGVAFQGVSSGMEDLMTKLEEKEQDKGGVGRAQRRIFDLLRKGSKAKFGETDRSWSLEFFKVPANFSPPSVREDPKAACSLVLSHTELTPGGGVRTTQETSSIDTHLIVPSLGSRSEEDAPWLDPHTGHLRAERGRLVDEQGRRIESVYASGWAANGARGVLASTMVDAYAVAEVILREGLRNDLPVGEPTGEVGVEGDTTSVGSESVRILPAAEQVKPGIPAQVEKAYEAGEVTDYQDWKAVDEEEIKRGEMLGKERERMTWEEAREIVQQARVKRT